MDAASAAIDPALLLREVGSFAIDSREVRAGDVFFALSQPEYRDNCFNGDFDDSTKYVVSAFEKGAVAAVVRSDRFEEHKAELEQFRDRLIFVEDAIAAFQRLSHGVYLEWDKKVVAITGSAGKTTAKELTAQVLEGSGRKVLKNVKNYNNGLGLPLTVLKLVADNSYDVAVLEMGMSTPMNEIARLCRITPPDIAVVLNVLPVHVEHLGSIENVAKAKAEIIEGMKPGGIAVLNADDPLVAEMQRLVPGETITFGIDKQADVMASEIESAGFGETSFLLTTEFDGGAKVTFPLNGKHNILNALAAAAIGRAFGMTANEIAKCLSSVTAPPQRGEVLHFVAGFTVINDSYNSNPSALMSMIETLVEAAGAKRKIVVAGEMLELGPDAEKIHRETGKGIAMSGVDILVGVRGLANEIVDGARSAGFGSAEFVEDSATAADRVAEIATAGDVILIKGSRGVRTEVIVEKLLEKFALEEEMAAAR